MSDYKAKMHEIWFRLGLRPRPRLGSLQLSPRPYIWFYGRTFKWRKGEMEGSQWVSASQKPLVTSLLMFSFIDNEIEAVGAYIKQVSKMQWDGFIYS